RAAVRHHQTGDGPRLFFDEGIEQGGRGNELDDPELQHQKSHQHHRSQKDDRSSDLIGAAASLSPSVTPPSSNSPSQKIQQPEPDNRDTPFFRLSGLHQSRFSHALTIYMATDSDRYAASTQSARLVGSG